MTPLEQKCNSLQEALVDDLLRRIRDGTATAADLGVAQRLLKDNNISVSDPNTMKPLADGIAGKLPFSPPEDVDFAIPGE